MDEFPNICWVEVHTDAGLVGLGETFFGARAVEAAMHETVAPQVLGQDALAIERHSRRLLQNYVGFNSTGAEIRAASAFDIALWHLFGQVTRQPIYQLLGGKVRDDLRTYNTCAGYRCVRAKPIQRTENWGLGGHTGSGPADRSNDGEQSTVNHAGLRLCNLSARTVRQPAISGR